MSFISKVGSAIGKLVIVGVLVAAFFAGMLFVVYRSLQGSEVAVPEIVGKNFAESEKELEALGLRIKKRADRYSEEAPNTVLEQIPRPGDTVKTGQMILVVTSKANAEGDEKPQTIKKGTQNTDEDDSKTIEELISDAPKKKSNSNSNTSNKKKASASRDVVNSGNSNTDTGATNSNKSEPATDDKDGGSTKENKNGAPPAAKTPAPKETPKPNSKPSPAADTRPRRNPD